MGTLTWLDAQTTDFPPASRAMTSPNGLLAAGGDLSPERLLRAYRNGIFPWYGEGQPILWWCPDPRTVLAPSELHIARSMRKFIRQNEFTISLDRAFPAVMAACAGPRRDTDATWITPAMQAAYTQLHRLGHAHSVEVWQGDELVGGLYGIALGKVFFGESMFSTRSNASKLAFVTLAQHLNDCGFALIDCQMPTDHLFSLGARSMPRAEFLRQLAHLCPATGKSNWRLPR
ncbi:MAG: leucyl/phenylalanyl-tRNA--protein transferase [Halopseudomonas sp.]|uniref:leucyl/phenylalanyl-tRNA--protein transferase n=1 Tax=Halopseudomonas sp. TaxID=2901191 RepID=UPI0030036E9F